MWKEIGERLLAVLYPARCPLCGAVMEADKLWCTACPKPLAGRIPLRGAPNLVDAAAPLLYRENVRRAVLRLKTRRDMPTLRFFAAEMHGTVLERWPDQSFDGIVPVPASPSALRERGFNQAELLGRELSARLGAPLLPRSLVRRDQTRTQHKLDRRRRLENAERSYRRGDPQGIEGKTILLVDDVFTTGATLAACAALLVGEGAEAVYAVTAAYTDVSTP